MTKAEFHRAATRQLKLLAKSLQLEPGEFDIRSNKGGPAIYGDITLHTDHVYVKATKSIGDPGLLIRSCTSRKDFTGGHNTFAPIDLLNDIPLLTARVRQTERRTAAPVE